MDPVRGTRSVTSLPRRGEAAGQDEVRRTNLSTLLRLLHEGGPTTRSDLGAATGLNRSTVGALTTELASLGLVQERPGTRSGKGRPSLVVEPAHAQVYAIAFDVTSTGVVGAAVGLGGYMLQVRRRLLGDGGHDPAGVVRLLASIVRDMVARAAPGSLCVGVCVSVPGSVRQPDGQVRRAPSLAWHEVPFAELLAAELPAVGCGPLPVRVGNDGDLGAVGEHLRGAARGYDDVLYIRGDAGVAGGVIVDGRLLRGGGGYAGEVGHLVVRPRGRTCVCGAKGCWEAEVGDAAIIRAVGRDPRESDIDDVLHDVEVGNRRAVAGVHRIGEQVGLGLVSLVNLLNPRVVVLGGSLGALYPTMEQQIHTALGQALGPIREQAVLVRSVLGADAQIVGAAETGFAELLDDPGGVVRRLLADADPAVARIG